MDALTVPRAHALAGFLPPEAPLAMPVQSLDGAGHFAQPIASARPVFARRVFVFATALAMSVVAAYEMYLVLAVGGLTTLEAVILALFVILFAWIALSFASTLGGVSALVTRRATSLDIDPAAPLPAIWPKGAAVPTVKFGALSCG